MSVFPEVRLSAGRLDIREYALGDLALVSEVLSRGEPEALPPGAPSASSGMAVWLADGLHRLRRAGDWVHLMMLDRAGGRIVGSIGLFHADWEVRSAEIGYGVGSGSRGNGYATEALAAVSRWALAEGGLQRVWLTANVDNVASVRVAEKSAMDRDSSKSKP